MATLVNVVALNVRTMREQQGLSLHELAAKAGVGKSTISLLESGKGNPSIETLWAIAAALGVPFGQMIEKRTPDVRVVRSGGGVKVEAEASHLQVRMLMSNSRRGLEVYVMESEPGSAHSAGPHITGTIEHIYMLTGRMRVGPKDDAVSIAAGDMASFAGDTPHIYETLEPSTRALMIMSYA